MNTCMSITCGVCEKDTDCRIGYSNRIIQPLSFACPHCGSLIQITLDISNAPASGFQFNSCHPSKNQPKGPFDGTNPFVDLHLDFPVRFGKYMPGLTPFMVAMQDLKDSTENSSQDAFYKLHFHNSRLEQLNFFHNKSDEIKTIIKLYGGSDKLLFKKKVGTFLKEDQGTSLKPEDINACLYRFISYVFLPFVDFGEVQEVVNGFSNLTTRLHSKPFSEFVEGVVVSGFLGTLQRDCLKIYPEIYAAEMPMRPALYLDLTDKYKESKIAARISTKDFQSYKDLYKDISEILARQLILVAGINNIIHRGSSNSFKEINGKPLSSLDRYASKVLSEKFKYLDNCWYLMDKELVNTGLRNAIAHNNVQYNEITQQIVYYPDGGRIEQAEGYTIYFLDFMRMILLLFRELHNLHHLIKCLFFYEYLIRSKK